jgi:hypothetical protein
MFRRALILIACAILLGLSGCSRTSQETAQKQNPPPAAPPQAQEPAPVSKPEAEVARPERAKPEPVKPAPQRASASPVRAVPPPASQPRVAPNSKTVSQPAVESKAAAEGAVSAVVPPVPATPPPALPPPPKPIIIPSGTRFEVRLLDPVSSETQKSGDTFRATLDQDLEVEGKVIVPKGNVVSGKLLAVRQSGRVEGRASLSMVLTDIEIDRTKYPIQTNTLSFEAEKSTKEDVTKVGIGAGLGALIGAIAGGGKGAAIGAAVGGGAGTATVLATRGKEVKFPTEEKFSFVLRKDLAVKQ